MMKRALERSARVFVAPFGGNSCGLQFCSPYRRSFAGGGGGGGGGGPEAGGGLPARTVPEGALRFTARAYLAADTAQRPANATGVHPAQCSVSLSVHGSKLGLGKGKELEALKIMAGPRWNEAKGELRLTCRLFPSRVENKKYLTYQLESLLQEARRAGGASESSTT